MKIALILLFAAACCALDLNWTGTYTVQNVAYYDPVNYTAGDASAMCCVPSSLTIAQNADNSSLMDLSFDFGSGSSTCDASVTGILSISDMPNEWGRFILNDSSSIMFNESHLIYLPNNNTLLFFTQNGCEVRFENELSIVTNGSDYPYKDRYAGIWAVVSTWSSDPNNDTCIMCSIKPILNAFDEFTKTQAWISTYSMNPACALDVQGTINYVNESVDGAASVGIDYIEFQHPNGSAIGYNAPPYCNVVWTVMKPSSSVSLCDYKANATPQDNEEGEAAATGAGGEGEAAAGAGGEGEAAAGSGSGVAAGEGETAPAGGEGDAAAGGN